MARKYTRKKPTKAAKLKSILRNTPRQLRVKLPMQFVRPTALRGR